LTDAFTHVRFGSKADICSAQAHVRFTPNSDIDRQGSTMQNDQNRRPGFLENATGQVIIVAIIVVVFVSMVLHLLWNAGVTANSRDGSQTQER